MRLFRVLTVLGPALLVTAALGGEITTLDGDVIKCDIVSVSPKEVVYKVGDKQLTRPIDKVLKIDFREPGKAPDAKDFSQVELTDGSVLLVSAWAIKKKNLEMTILSGPTVTMPTGVVLSILNEAKDEKYRRGWRNRVINTRGKEALVTRTIPKDKNGREVIGDDGKPLEVINNLPSTLGDGDDKGETIEAVIQFDNEEPRKISRKQKELHGIIFKNVLDAKAPPAVCKLLDTLQNVVMVSSVAAKEGGGVTVTTPAGAKIEFGPEQLAQLDYTRGKLDYLSALTPDKTTITVNALDKGSPTDHKWYVYKDASLMDGKPIKVGGTAYRQGLTLLPDIELEYDLRGDYREFTAVVGIDDETKAEGEGTLLIEGNGRELISVPIVYKTEKGKNGEPTKPARPFRKVALNIKDVQKLKITFKAKDELNGLSLSVSLGDAKVSK